MNWKGVLPHWRTEMGTNSMSLNRRVESLEERSGANSEIHLIFTDKGELQSEALERYCSENNLQPEQLKSVVYFTPRDTACL